MGCTLSRLNPFHTPFFISLSSISMVSSNVCLDIEQVHLNTKPDLFGILATSLTILNEVHCFLQSQADGNVMPQIMSQPLLSTSFPINYSLVIVPFSSAWSELLKVPLSQHKQNKYVKISSWDCVHTNDMQNFSQIRGFHSAGFS